MIACIQQVPQGDSENPGEGAALEMQEISAEAESYLDAVEEVHARVPEGWRVLYVRSESPTPAAVEVAAGDIDGSSTGPEGAEPADAQPRSDS